MRTHSSSVDNRRSHGAQNQAQLQVERLEERQLLSSGHELSHIGPIAIIEAQAATREVAMHMPGVRPSQIPPTRMPIPGIPLPNPVIIDSGNVLPSLVPAVTLPSDVRPIYTPVFAQPGLPPTRMPIPGIPLPNPVFI
jgi:hypothetical protein